ncbi:relaxase/mobilization nuclease domain-containing protein, partial [Calothrix sp. UHCC 0171]|uniref:relaxase/mobilization nuclease domain-containing protein n=1 Tax=Calothrix sp. UHCC 0171 TaxID=3110245 RepID=UPI002B209571
MGSLPVIANQLKNRSFRSTLDYVLEKEEAEIIDSNMGGYNSRQLAKEFSAARRMRPNFQRACGHIILSIPHRDASHPQGEYHEHLDDEKYAELAQRWLKGMEFLGDGLHKSQYVIARHHDTNHEHIHIIASRIRMDGSVVPDSWDYRRSEVIVRQLEKEFGLEPVPCSNEQVARKVQEIWEIDTTVGDTPERRLLLDDTPVEISYRDRRAQTKKQRHHFSGKPPVTQLLADAIDAATQDKPTVTELITRLQQQDITVHPSFSTQGKFKEAVAYSMDGVKVAGWKLGKAYSFPGLLQRRGVDYQPERG